MIRGCCDILLWTSVYVQCNVMRGFIDCDDDAYLCCDYVQVGRLDALELLNESPLRQNGSTVLL